MKANLLRFAFLSLPLLVGCAQSGETGDVAPKKPVDAAGLDVQRDTSNDDTSVTDSSMEDSGGSCTPLTSEKRPCGRCGKQTRVCTPTGTWGPFSICADELTTSSCTIGEVQSNPCGNCGKQVDTCDPETCEWVTGSCSGEGLCAEGDKEEISASCTVVGEVRTRICDSKCAWGPYSECSLPKGFVAMASAPTGFEARGFHTAVWTGTNMIVWGGFGSYVSPTYVYIKPDGASYDLAANSWKKIAAAPSAFSQGRWQHTAVWTGSKMVIFGGLYYYTESSSYAKNDGAIYDPTADSWTATATPTLTARWGHTAAWSTTTNEMIVWGGYTGSTYMNDGASYNPTTNTWTPLPAAPISGRYRHSMVWTGTELIIWGGMGASGYVRDGARYDPNTKVWTKFPDPPSDFDGRQFNAAVWSGKELIVYGGYSTYVSPAYGRGDGARYTPGGSWTKFVPSATDIFATGTSNIRQGMQAFWGSGKLYMWSGAAATYSGNPIYYSNTALSGMASYDPTTDKWTTVDTTGAPTNRARASVVWTGKEAIIWGGSNSGGGTSATHFADGIIFRP